MGGRPATLAGWRTTETHRRAVGSLDSNLETRQRRQVCSGSAGLSAITLLCPGAKRMLQPTRSPCQHGPDLGGHDQGKELRGPGSWAEIGEAAAATGDEGQGGLRLRLRLSGAAVPTQAVPQSLRQWPARAESPRAMLAPARLPSGAKGLCRETGKHGLKGNGTSSALTLEYSSAVKKRMKFFHVQQCRWT